MELLIGIVRDAVLLLSKLKAVTIKQFILDIVAQFCIICKQVI